MINTFIIVGSAAVAAVLCSLIEHAPAIGEPLAIGVLLGVGILRTSAEQIAMQARESARKCC
jgi:hypothetical protein